MKEETINTGKNWNKYTNHKIINKMLTIQHTSTVSIQAQWRHEQIGKLSQIL